MQGVSASERKVLISVSATMLLGIAAFWGGLENLVYRWLQSEEYSHGFFLPVISLWLLWERREALRRSLGRPAWTGVYLAAIALVMLVLGELSAIFVLIQLGFLLLLAAIVLAVGGVSLLRVSLLPVVLLLFAIPMPYFIDAQLSWGLQLLSSAWGVDLLRLLGISVYLQGNVIDLGVYKLQVVEACSGLRYLYPLMSLGFLAAYLFQAPWWQRATLFLSTIPITVVMNSFRISVIGFLVERWGVGQAEGFLHFFEGWVIFMACAALLLAEIWLFVRLSGRSSVSEVIYFSEVKPVQPSRPAARENTKLVFAILLLTALALVAVVAVSDRVEVQLERKPLTLFPLHLGEWQAREEHLEPVIEEGLGLDDYLLADYRNAEGNKINFYVAYYGSQRKGVSPHSPRVCIPGGGWLITDHVREPFKPASGESEFPLNRIVIERDEHRQLVYYWFEQRGRRIANEYWMKWYLLQDAVIDNRTDGALVRVTTPLSPEESIASADQRLRKFLQLVVPEIVTFVPN